MVTSGLVGGGGVKVLGPGDDCPPDPASEDDTLVVAASPWNQFGAGEIDRLNYPVEYGRCASGTPSTDRQPLRDLP